MSDEASSSRDQASAASRQQVLLCQVGSVVCGIPLGHVSETMRPPPLERLPGTAAFVDGVSMIRGAALPVVDLARLLGSRSSQVRTRLVVVRVGQEQAALSVQSVIGIRSIDSDSVREMPSLLGMASADIVSAIGALDARLLLVLETSRVLPSSGWATSVALGEEA